MVSTPLDIPITRAPRGERSVYTWGAIAAIAIAFAGFAPSYYLKGVFGTPELTSLKHLHGVVMSAWFLLFFVQVRLVANGRTDIHRMLGVAGIVLAVLVVYMGLSNGIASARAGFAPPGIPPLVFLVLPVGEMITFTALVTAAVVLRKKSPWHKRLMLVASLAMLTPAWARMVILATGLAIPPLFFALTDAVIIACAVYDWRRNGRFHPAFTWAIALVVVVQFGRLALSQTNAWTEFAKWLIA